MQRLERGQRKIPVTSESAGDIFSEFGRYVANRARLLGPEYAVEADFFSRWADIQADTARVLARHAEFEGKKFKMHALSDLVASVHYSSDLFVFPRNDNQAPNKTDGITTPAQAVCRLLQNFDAHPTFQPTPQISIRDTSRFEPSERNKYGHTKEQIDFLLKVKGRVYDLLDAQLIGEVYPNIENQRHFHRSRLVYTTGIGLVILENHEYHDYTQGPEHRTWIVIARPSPKPTPLARNRRYPKAPSC